MRPSLRSAATLLVAFLVWLPRSAGAGPLVLELRGDLRHLGGSERERLERLLDEVAVALAAPEAAGFAALIDTARGAALRARAADSALAYPEPLGTWLRVGGDAAAAPAALHRALAGLPAALPPAAARDERLALVRVDSAFAWPLHLPPGLQPLRLAHKGRLDPDPRLAPILLLSVPTALAWEDPRCSPWRRPPAPGGGTCPVVPGALALELDPWAGRAEREAFLDSLFASEPQLRDLGWLKRRLARKALAGLFVNLLRQQAAWLECRFQRGDSPPPPGPPPGAAGLPPTCPLGDPALLRLLFLPDGDQRWRLALAWLSPYALADFASASLEPGYGQWLRDYSEWMEQVEQRAD